MLASVGLSVGPLSVTSRKRRRLLVTLERYIEVGTADSVAAFRSYPDAPWGDSLVLNKKRYFQNMNTTSCLTTDSVKLLKQLTHLLKTHL